MAQRFLRLRYEMLAVAIFGNQIDNDSSIGYVVRRAAAASKSKIVHGNRMMIIPRMIQELCNRWQPQHSGAYLSVGIFASSFRIPCPPTHAP